MDFNVDKLSKDLADAILDNLSNGTETEEDLEIVRKQIHGVCSRLKDIKELPSIFIAVRGTDSNGIELHASTSLNL